MIYRGTNMQKQVCTAPTAAQGLNITRAQILTYILQVQFFYF